MVKSFMAQLLMAGGERVKGKGVWRAAAADTVSQEAVLALTGAVQRQGE
jgi:hypothetical protein